MNAFFVLGMHRSGTSALTRIINILGVQAPKTLMPPTQFNKTGYWESPEIMKVNDKILDALDRKWYDPKPLNLNQLSQAQVDYFSRSINRTIDSEFSKESDIVIKDPRITRLFPLWANCLEKRNIRPICVLALRNPLDVAKSLTKRDGFSRNIGLELWKSYMFEIELHTRHYQRGIVQYEHIMQDCLAEIKRLGKYLQAIERLDVSKYIMEINDHLDTELQNHVSSSNDLSELKNKNISLAALYDALKSNDKLSTSSEIDELRHHWEKKWKASSPGPSHSALSKTTPVYVLSKANLTLEDGDLGRAINSITVAMEQNPTYPEFYFRLAFYLKLDGRFSEALDTLKAVKEIEPQNGRADFNMAQIYEKLGDKNKTLNAAKTAVIKSPDQVYYLHYYGLQLLDANNLGEAELIAKSTINLNANSARNRILLGHVYSRQGNKQSAIKCVEVALSLNQTNPDFYNFYGTLLKSQNRLKMAQMAFEQAVKLDPNNGNYYIALGNVLNAINLMAENDTKL